jgi:hypothetical protein
VGGIGSCGRELCCSTWLTDFKSVNTNAARYQNLSINQTKLSGQCGRLKCCLNYELDTYLDALQFFPTDCDTLEVAKGRAFLVKKDIFRNLMWYTLPESNKQYPLAIETVKKIKAQNRDGIRPEELETAEVITSKPKEVEPLYADIVGQISLRSLEKNSRKRREKEKGQQQRQAGNSPKQAGQPNQARGQNQRPEQRRPQQNQVTNNPQKQVTQPGNRPAQGNRPPQNNNRPPQQRGPRQDRPQQQRPPQQGNRPGGNAPNPAP